MKPTAILVLLLFLTGCPDNPQPPATPGGPAFQAGQMIDSTTLEREKEAAVQEARILWEQQSLAFRNLPPRQRVIYVAVDPDTVFVETGTVFDSLQAGDAFRLLAAIDSLIDENARLKDIVAHAQLDSMRYLLATGEMIFYDAGISHFLRSGEMDLDLRLYSKPETSIAVVPDPTWLDWTKDAGLWTAAAYTLLDIIKTLIQKD